MKIKKRGIWIITALILCALLSGVFGTGAYAQEAAPPTITINNKAGAEINIRDTLQLTYTFKPIYFTNKTVTWTSSDAAVATVENGLITGVGEGEAFITAAWTTDPTVKASYKIKVKYVKPTKITMTGNTTMTTGAVKKLAATLTPAYATNRTIIWNSEHKDIAVVDESGNVTAAEQLPYNINSKNGKPATITAKAEADNGLEAVCIVTVKPKAPSVIRLTPASMTLGEGKKGDITFALIPSDAGIHADTIKEVTTSKPGVATAVTTKDEDGQDIIRVSAKAKGKAVITVTTFNGKTDKCTINVTGDPPTIATKGTANFSMTLKGGTKEIKAAVNPYNASGNIIWESSDAKVASVKSGGKPKALNSNTTKGEAKATVTARGHGICTITARSSIGGVTQAVFTVTVNENLPTAYKMGKTTTKIRAGTKETLKATNISPAKTDVMWHSSNEAVATVSSNGTVTGIKPGLAEITLRTAKGNGAKCVVTVMDRYANEKRESAAPIANNAVISDACLYPKDDVDFFHFTPKETSDVTINLMDVPDGCNYELYLLNSSGTTIHNTEKSKDYKSITATLSSEKHTIKVASKNGVYSPEFYKLQLIYGPQGSMPTSVDISGVPKNILKYNDTVRLTARVYPSGTVNQTVIWTSSDPETAEVSDTGIVRVKSSEREASAVITARTSFGMVFATCDINIKNIPVTGVDILPDEAVTAMGINANLLFTADVSPADASNKTVRWSSSDSSVAAVTSDGFVTGKSAGTAIITVRTESGGIEAARAVTVSEIMPTSLRLSRSTADLKLNSSMPITAIIMPADASDKSALWESSDPSVATVHGGTLYGRAEGSAVITATSAADGLISDTCDVTVTFQPPTGVSLSPPALAARIGETKRISASVLPNNASDKTLEWSSSNEGVAIVDAGGTITAVSAGEAEITATPAAGGTPGKCTVTVSDETLPDEIAIEGWDPEIVVGGTLRLTAEVGPPDAANKEVRWSSGDTWIATISGDGVVTARNEGKVIFTAEAAAGGASASCEVEVKTVGISGFALRYNDSEKNADNIYLGLEAAAAEKSVFTVKIEPANATCQSVVWSNSDARIGSISDEGVFTPKRAGVTTITALAETGEAMAVCKITVVSSATPPTKASIDSPDSVLLGRSIQLKAVITPTNCTNKQVKWTSSNEGVATVDENGVVTALALGKAKITATTDQPGKTKADKLKTIYGTKTITVKPVKPSSVSIKPASMMRPGETQRMEAVLKPQDVTGPVVKWSVNNTKLATIEGGVLKAKAKGTVVVKATVYSKHATATKKTKTMRVKIVEDPASFTISQASKYKTKAMKPGQTQTMQVNIKPDAAGDRTIVWRSDNTEVLTVSKKGVVKAVGSGTATITASIDSVKDPPAIEAKCEIEVEIIPPKKITLPKDPTLGVNESKRFAVKFNTANATKALKWASSDDKIAVVDDKGVVTGIKAGKTTITAYSAVAPMIAAECAVTVKVIPPKKVTVTTSNKKPIYPGDSILFKAKVTPAGCSNKEVNWTSSNEYVLTIDEQGRITANNPGDAVVKATTKMKGKEGKAFTSSYKVKVKPRLATKVSVVPTSVSLSANSTQQLAYTYQPANVTNNVPVYKSADSKIAFVSESGLITALKKGRTTISVKIGGKTATCKVEVTTSPPKSLDLLINGVDGNEKTLIVGEKAALTAKVNPTKYADQSVSFRSSNPQVAEVTTEGAVTAIGAGVCEIIVSSDVGAIESSYIISVFDPKQIARVEKAELQTGASMDLKSMLSGGAGHEWIWASNRPDVAEVGHDGVVTAKQPGKATIVACTLWGDSVTFDIEVI